ncbi:MAG: hypothetical protein U1F43_04550 [Myxococcota bacterium]
MSLSRSAIFARATLATATLAVAPTAAARSWCAQPLYVHEWGVHVFGAGGAPAAAAPWPDFFHTTVGVGDAAAAVPVRAMPVDGGVRFLPVLHFYGPPGGAMPTAIGLEVGFSAGSASAWFPALDLFRTGAEANSAKAAAARAALLARRAARTPFGQGDGKDVPLPSDPTRQLVWDLIELTGQAPSAPAASTAPWIQAARGFDSLWASAHGETDRFVFYEGQTAERVPLTLRRAAGWAVGHRAYELANTSAQAIHDVFIVQRDGERVFVVSIPAIAAGAATTFVLDQHPVAAADLHAATYDALKAALGSAAGPPAATGFGPGACTMGRDPAIPFEKADGHELFAPEVDALLSVWGARFFEQAGTTIVYREDEAALDAAMPLSIYADMHRYVVLERAGLALWESVALP